MCTAIAATGGPTTPGFDGLECEGSAWLGALQEKSPSGASVHVFKSWAQRRRADPEHILLERRFKHPLISRSTIKAARALSQLQGRKGLYFSGHYTTGMDLQESALYSAMKVAEALAPGQPDPGVAEDAFERARTRRHFVRPLGLRRAALASKRTDQRVSGHKRPDELQQQEAQQPFMGRHDG